MPLNFCTDKRRIRILVESARAPAAPSGLLTTASSSSEIDLSWTDNSNNEAGFWIERSPDGSTWASLATVAANVTAYANTGLASGTTYYYRVSAFNGAGNSAKSNTASATTGGGAVTLYTLTGPAFGTTGTASSNFTVTLGAGTLVGTTTITPSATGGSGTFSPTSVNLTNSARTATFTFTPAASATYTLSTTNNGGLTNPASLTFVSSTAVNIDAAFLAANAASYGGPPYALTQANTTYRLQQNVTTPGTAFLYNAENITLELNGYTITYDQTTQPAVPNAFFNNDAIGTGPTISNWAITGLAASSAVVVANTDPLSSPNTLKIDPLYYPAGHNLYGASHLRLTIPNAQAATLTNVGGVATLTTSTPHGLATGDRVFPNGFASTPTIVNTFYTVTVTSTTQFTLTDVTLTGVTGASGRFSQATILVSDPITIDEANVYYAGCLSTADGLPAPGSHIVLMEILQDGAVLPTQTTEAGTLPNPLSAGSGNTRADKVLCVVSPPNTHSLQLRILIANTVANAVQTVYVSRALVTKSHRHGIVIAGQDYNSYPAYKSWPAAFQTYYRSNNHAPIVWTMQDSATGPVGAGGAVVQGTGTGLRSYPIDARGTQGVFTIHDVTLTASGDDSIALRYMSTNASASGTITIGGAPGRGCTFKFIPGQLMTHRTNGYNAVHGDQLYGDNTACVISYNTFLDYPQAGIHNPVFQFPGNHVHTSILIEHNSFYPRSTCADPYAYAVGYTPLGTTCRYNLVDAITDPLRSGHGVYCSAVNTTLANITIDHEEMHCKFLGSGEVGDTNPARAFRLRGTENGVTTGGSFQNLRITNGLFEAISGPGSNAPAALLTLFYLPAPFAIASINTTPANTCKINRTQHGVLEGELVLLDGFNTTPTINGWQTAHLIDANNFYVNIAVTVVNSAGSARYCRKTLFDMMSDPENIVLSGNTWRSIVMDPAHKAAAVEIGLMEQDPTGTYPNGPTLTHRNDIMDSNSTSLWLPDNNVTNGTIGRIYTDHCTYSENTTYPGGISPGNIVPTDQFFHRGYTPVFMGDTTSSLVESRAITPSYAGGAAEGAMVCAHVNMNHTINFNVAITVTDSATGLPIAGATVQVLNASSAVDSTSTTDAGGLTAGLLAKVRSYNGTSPLTPINATLTSYTPHTLSISATNYITRSISIGTLTGDFSATESLTHA